MGVLILCIFSHFFLVFTDRERPYLIVKAVIRLSDPAAMDLVLRKRICFNVYKRHSITDKIRRRMGHTSSLTSLGVVYEIVSNIPKVSSDTLQYRHLAPKIVLTNCEKILILKILGLSSASPRNF